MIESGMANDLDEVPDLFGGPLTIDLINKTLRQIKQMNPELATIGPFIIPAGLYDRAKASGMDLSGCVRQEPTPLATEAFPPESDLPDWEDLRGRAPDITGDLSSEAFVRELRSGWR